MADALTPNHYRIAVHCDPLDLMRVAGGDLLRAFCLGNALKYAARAGQKEGETALEDLTKARHYLEEIGDARRWVLRRGQLAAGALEAVPAARTAQVLFALLDAYHANDLATLSLAHAYVDAWVKLLERRAA